MLRTVLVLGAMAAVLAGCGAGTGTTTVTVTRTAAATVPAKQGPLAGAVAFQEALVAVVNKVEPSVVQISTAQGLGSGVVFDAKGDIVTNAHVVGTAKTFTVTTYDGKTLKGTLVGTFPPDDLAVIRVTGAKLKPAQWGNSSALDVGDLAIAIGNPLGLQSSVTEGIVSAFRQGVSEPNNVTIPLMIQTSAPINPGNSGGALADISARVIGIPTLAATDPQLGGGSAPGIGFAIPSNLVKDIAGQIVKYGRVVDSHRAYLGITVGDTNGNGVYVVSVVAGTPAAKAGMRVGELIVAVNGKATPTVAALGTILATLKPGQTVPVVLESQTGARRTLKVKLGTLPGSS